MKGDQHKTIEQSIKEPQELRQRITELEAAESQRKKSEEALRQSENKYRFLVDNTREIILIISKRGKIIFANKSTLTNYGYSQDELIGQSITKFLTRDCFKTVLYALAQEFLGRPQPEIEIRTKTKSGEIRYLKVAEGSVPIYDKGKLMGIMISATDITEHRRAEEKLRESEARFKELWDNAPVAYHTLDAKGIITSVNQTEAKMLGYTKEEMIGKFIFEFILPEQRAEAQKRYQQKISGHCTPKAENRIYVKKNGSKIYFSIDDVLERDKNGKVIGIRSTMVDVTKDKELEGALRISEEHYRDLVEKAGIAITIEDKEGNLKYANERYAGIFGYSMEEMKKQPIRSLVHPDDAERVMTYHQGRLQGKKVPARYEFKGVRKDGSIIDIEVDANVRREGENIVETRSYLRDITERRQAEEALQKRSAQLELIHHIQSEIPMNTDMETILIRAAESIGKSFGYYKISVNLYDRETQEIEYLTGWNKTGLPIPRGHRQKLGQGLIGKAGLLRQTIIANDVSQEPDYIPFHLTETKAELIIPLLVQDQLLGVLDLQATEAGAFLKEDVSVLQAVANYIAYIIDEKQQEELLRKERDKAQKYLDIAGVMIVILDPSAKVTLINKKGCEILGYAEHEIIGKNWFETCVPAQIKDELQLVFKRLVAGEIEPVEYYENPVLTQQGEERIIAWHNIPLKDEAGNIIGILSSGEDITERKKAEERLNESERKLKEAQALGNIGSWEYDLATQKIEWSDQVYELYERDRKLGPPSPDQEASYYSPEQARILREYARLAAEEGKMFKYDLTAKLPSGRTAYFSASMRPVKEEKGRVIKLFCTVQDITERKKAEQEVQRRAAQATLLYKVGQRVSSKLELQALLSEIVTSIRDAFDYYGVMLLLLDEEEKVLHLQSIAGAYVDIFAKDQKVEIGKGMIGRAVTSGRIQVSGDVSTNPYYYRWANEKTNSEMALPIKSGEKVIGVLDVQSDCYNAFDETDIASIEILGTQIAAAIENARLYDRAQREITERKKAEAEIRESEERFKRISYVTSDFTFSCTKKTMKDGYVIDWMAGAVERITGYSIAEIKAWGCWKRLVLKEDMPVFEEKVIGLAPGKSCGCELRIRHKDGSVIWLRTLSECIIDPNDSLVHRLYGGCQDITDRKRSEEELRKSEERFKLVFEYAPDACYLCDLKGNFIDGNRAAERLTGYKREELIGGNFLKLALLSLDQMPKAAALLAKNAMRKPTGPDEFLLKRKNGSKLSVEISTHPVKLEGRTVVLGIARDITERKQAEEALRESERKLRLLTESMRDVVFVYDMNRRLLYVNPAVEELTGYSIQELYEHNFINYLHPEDQERMMKLWDELFQGKSFSGEELRIVTKDGKIKWCSSSWGPLFDENGNQIGIQGRESDITESKLAKKQLEESFNNLRKAMNGIIQAIALTVERRDPYTAGHQRRAADLARAIATEMALPKDKIEGIRVAGIIHDIGKISIPAEILSKPGNLNEFEFHIIKDHAKVGYEILKELEFPWPIAQIVFQHHERIDGSGYPQGLTGEDILLEARILGVADVVEAMASHRPYRPAKGIEKALEEILQNKGRLYDPEVVEACLKVFTKNKFEFKL